MDFEDIKCLIKWHLNEQLDQELNSVDDLLQIVSDTLETFRPKMRQVFRSRPRTWISVWSSKRDGCASYFPKQLEYFIENCCDDPSIKQKDIPRHFWNNLIETGNDHLILQWASEVEQTISNLPPKSINIEYLPVKGAAQPKKMKGTPLLLDPPLNSKSESVQLATVSNSGKKVKEPRSAPVSSSAPRYSRTIEVSDSE